MMILVVVVVVVVVMMTLQQCASLPQPLPYHCTVCVNLRRVRT
jgi:hypothetical protein